MIENCILPGNCLDTLKTLPDCSVDCYVTSPPYFNLRDYGGVAGQIGLEKTPEEYIRNLMRVFQEVRRVLKDKGTCWVIIGDSYNGSGKNTGNSRPLAKMQSNNGASCINKPLLLQNMPPKSLIGIPWLFAAAMRQYFIFRQDIVWAKTDPMPESVKDRFCRSHEYIFLFSKQSKYYFDHNHALENSIIYHKQRQSLKQRGYKQKPQKTGLRAQHHGNSIDTGSFRTMRDVWFVATEKSEERHFAMFPKRLILPCILCGCPENGTVLDPFMGSGTTAVVALNHFRKYIGCEINPEYIKIAEKRIAAERGLWDE